MIPDRIVDLILNAIYDSDESLIEFKSLIDGIESRISNRILNPSEIELNLEVGSSIQKAID